MPRLYHVTSVRNRDSIGTFGLDWSRMGAAPGIAGSHGPEVEGGIDLDRLRTSPEGYEFYPDTIPAAQLTLVRQGVVSG